MAFYLHHELPITIGVDFFFHLLVGIDGARPNFSGNRILFLIFNNLIFEIRISPS